MGAGPSPLLGDLLPGGAALPAELVGELDRCSTVHDVAGGTVLLRQRAVVADLIVLVRGRIATLIDFAGTGDLVVETTEEPGRVFGWSGLVAPGRSTATVRADAESRIVTVPLAVVHAGPPRWTAAVCGLVAGALADRTRDLQARLARPAAESDEARELSVPSRRPEGFGDA
ncbi:cyclic nucleotide-binding domain-containing protein [Pseudonocardia sp. RS11V-5]|uniref:cyclic nucleotide-binding domain-containing protein n=1 Tax=Pseudonocardia terrae TaxID=2905831 RepID=UPI001E5CDF91|nr:cyclic nucleotide-binding domain-containing protein [Pseudonocardia terrae]MCE3555140.1 cyclic nucleotide-binding domain-containing protein [Pseudonocardia terrae]